MEFSAAAAATPPPIAAAATSATAPAPAPSAVAAAAADFPAMQICQANLPSFNSPSFGFKTYFI